MDELVSKYAPGGIVRAPDESNVVSEWFISNEGAAWFVISRGATHRIVTRTQLDTWQTRKLGEPVDDDLTQEPVAPVEPSSRSNGFTRRVLAAVSPQFGRSLETVRDVSYFLIVVAAASWLLVKLMEAGITACAV